MDRKARIVAGVLGVIAGLLYVYNAIAERPAGAPFPTGGIAMGLFWVALGIYFFSGAGKHDGSDKR